MPTSPLNGVIQHLLADRRPEGDAPTDPELFARFLRSRDEEALAALVRRHAPMVWGVCRRLLAHHDAEDAFQATFLVLVRKAAEVPKLAIANWLYGVARQTAVRVRATAAKRGRWERQVVNMPEPEDRGQGSGVRGQENAELQAVLDEEVGRLPAHYRSVVVLCDLEGMTRKEAARQLGIPEGSVASRLARARVMLARRLTQRGVVVASGVALAARGSSVAAVLSAGSASAFVPPALVVSTIQAASLLAAGQAAGVVSAKVAALTEGMVKTMFVTKLKSVSVVVLVLGLILGGIGAGVGLTTNPAAVAQEKTPNKAPAKDESPTPPVAAKKDDKQKPPAAKSDRERLVGNWFIMNDDSARRGEMWAITEDSILMHAKSGGANSVHYAHRLDESKDPKQIDITVTRINGPTLGVIKGIYALDGDELRVCLGALNKDRPSEFPKKPAWGELLILQRSPHGATPPKAKEQPPAKTDQERMLGGWVIVKNDGNRKREGEGWLIEKDEIVMNPNLTGIRVVRHFYRLDAGKNPKQIDIDVKKTNGEHVGVIKGIYAFTEDTELWLCLGEIGKDRPTEFAGKPGQSEFLILHGGNPEAWQRKVAKDEKLRMLIDKVLAAHGGEDKLNKLTSFTMTVKHANAETQHYFVQPPKNFRWETTHRDHPGKRIVILFPEGRRWWTKQPNEDAKEFIPLGAEPTMDYWLDYVKFFGPRQVLRLKDADHKVVLLEEETKIGDRPAVGVQVTGPRSLVVRGEHRMYFDKETHLLLKSGAVTYSDYKKFDGISIAQKENDGYLMPQVTDFKVVEKFDAKLFEKP